MALALVVAYLHGLVYVFTIHPWDLFDEDVFLGYSLVLRDQHRPPTFADPLPRSVTASEYALARWKYLRLPPPAAKPPQVTTWWFGDHLYESHHPPLYPLLVAPFTFPGGSSALKTLYAARMLGPFLLAILVGLTWALARAWVPRSLTLVPFVAAMIVAVLPAAAESAGRVDNDLLEAVFVTATLLAATRLAHRPSLRQSLVLGALAMAALLTKETGLLTLAVSGVSVAYLVWKRRASWPMAVAALLPAVLGMAAWAAWIHSRYGVWEGSTAFANLTGHGLFRPLASPALVKAVWYSTWSSYWAFYPAGRLGVGVSVAVTALGAFAVVGLLRRSPLRIKRFGLLVTAALGAPFVVAIWAGNASAFAVPQARFYLGFAAPAAILVAVGWARLVRDERAAIFAAVAACALSVTFFAGWFLPFFYGRSTG